MTLTAAVPAADCDRCPRLAAFRSAYRSAEPDWFNAPVPPFGSDEAAFLIVGLAPGLRGANRTGRPFTGDYAGDLLYATLLKFGFASGDYRQRADDGLRLIDTRITNAVRCVPPENKPTPAEAASCRPFLASEMGSLGSLRTILALGRLAHDQILTTLGAKRAAYPFAHGVRHALANGLALWNSYHCSRYNTNTGRLTTEMFEAVLSAIRAEIGAPAG